jgi:hypothetical protein
LSFAVFRPTGTVAAAKGAADQARRQKIRTIPKTGLKIEANLEVNSKMVFNPMKYRRVPVSCSVD